MRLLAVTCLECLADVILLRLPGEDDHDLCARCAALASVAGAPLRSHVLDPLEPAGADPVDAEPRTVAVAHGDVPVVERTR